MQCVRIHHRGKPILMGFFLSTDKKKPMQRGNRTETTEIVYGCIVKDSFSSDPASNMTVM
jgi:hypothetical protein